MPRIRGQVLARYELRLRLKLRAILQISHEVEEARCRETFRSFKGMSVPRHKKLKHELNRYNDVIFLNSVWESERKEHSLLVPATFLHGGTRYFLSIRT